MSSPLRSRASRIVEWHRPGVNRTGWAICDQVMSSLSNIVLISLVARSVDPRTFGRFAFVYAIYVLVVQSAQAALAEPFLVRDSGYDGRTTEKAAAYVGAVVVLGGI